jgi:hypothetical protein
MRCRNCHTQLMETDTHCPSCHSSVGRATAAAPGEIKGNSGGLLMMLPIFGGAAGGLLYGAIKATQESMDPSAGRPCGRASAAAAPARPARSGVGKLLVGVVFLFGGALLVGVGVREAWSTWNVSRRQATEVTAAELGRPDFAASAPAWIRFPFAESKRTGLAVKRKRQSGGGEADARCLLVRVEDRWLVATVPPGFQGTELTGYVVPFDPTASRPLLERVAKAEPEATALLPFEFNGVEGSAGDQERRHTAAAILGFFGLMGVLLGVYFIPFRSRSAAVAAPGRAI